MEKKQNPKPVFWLVLYGDHLRVSNKTASAAEACKQAFGMVAWNMAVKALTGRKSDIQNSKWFQQQVKSPDGWHVVPENELPTRLDREMRRINNPRVINGVVRWKDDGKEPPLAEPAPAVDYEEMTAALPEGAESAFIEDGAPAADIKQPDFSGIRATMLRDAGIFTDRAIDESREGGRVAFDTFHGLLSRVNVAAQAVTDTASFIEFKDALVALTDKSSAHEQRSGAEWCPEHGVPQRRHYDRECATCREIVTEQTEGGRRE